MRNETKICIRVSMAVLALCGLGFVVPQTGCAATAYGSSGYVAGNGISITKNEDVDTYSIDIADDSKSYLTATDKGLGLNVSNQISDGEGKLVSSQAVYDYLHQDEVEMGAGSTAWGRNSIALGGSSNAYGKGSVALGYLTKAGTSETNADDVYATALGYFAYAQAANSIAIGDAYVEAYANQGIAIGKYSKALEKNSVAIGGNAIEGESAQARGVSSVAIGDRSKAGGRESLALGYYAYAMAPGSVAVGDCYVSPDANQGVAIGKYSKALAANAVAIGGNENEEAGGAYAKGWSAVALGDGSKAYGMGSVALGYGAQAGPETITDVETEVYATAIGHNTKASGVFSTAVGYENTAEGDRSVVVGTGSTVTGANSIVIGTGNQVSGSNVFVLGNSVKTTVSNAVILGNESTATEDNVVSVGSEKNPRKIVNVAKGENDTDAVNVAQLKDAVSGTVVSVNQALSDLDSRVNKVGAGAAALAALHPGMYNPEDKTSFAVGYGHYQNANAGAFGAFFRPNEDVTVSVGSTFGNGNPMMNAGVSFKLGQRGKHFAPTDAGAIQRLITENASQAKQIEALANDNAKLKADNEKMQTQIAMILSKMEMSGAVAKTATK